MRSYTFTIVIEKEPEDPGYYAHCPELPGCVSGGATLDETRGNIGEAIQLYLESLLEDGLPLPDAASDVHVERVTIALPA
jgi:predicted RNase H-like HicB family nuclease